MNSPAAIEAICRIPVTFRAGEKSVHDLIRESGIAHRSLTREALVAFLSKHETLIAEWLRLSDDQRCSPAYYFNEEKGTYVVGHYPGTDREIFDDPIKACADFIVKHVNLIW